MFTRNVAEVLCFAGPLSTQTTLLQIILLCLINVATEQNPGSNYII